MLNSYCFAVTMFIVNLSFGKEEDHGSQDFRAGKTKSRKG